MNMQPGVPLGIDGVEDINNEPHEKDYLQYRLRQVDDMIFFLKPGENAESFWSKIDRFLEVRGLKIEDFKSQQVKSTDGFDFLGWHFKVKAKN